MKQYFQGYKENIPKEKEPEDWVKDKEFQSILEMHMRRTAWHSGQWQTKITRTKKKNGGDFHCKRLLNKHNPEPNGQFD